MRRNDWKGNGFMYWDAKVRTQRLIITQNTLRLNGFIKDQGRGN